MDLPSLRRTANCTNVIWVLLRKLTVVEIGVEAILRH